MICFYNSKKIDKKNYTACVISTKHPLNMIGLCKKLGGKKKLPISLRILMFQHLVLLYDKLSIEKLVPCIGYTRKAPVAAVLVPQRRPPFRI